MNDKYISAELEIIAFENEDVITTSEHEPETEWM